MKEKPHLAAQRDMQTSGIGKILEIFFGGNHAVTAVVVFDSTGETVDYHSVLDPFDTRLSAAYCGILFESARYRMAWLAQATLQSIEYSCENFDIITLPVCEEFFLAILAQPGTIDETMRDTISGAIEALVQDIG